MTGSGAAPKNGRRRVPPRRFVSCRSARRSPKNERQAAAEYHGVLISTHIVDIQSLRRNVSLNRTGFDQISILVFDRYVLAVRKLYAQGE
jgi:hypothetical protein